MHPTVYCTVFHCTLLYIALCFTASYCIAVECSELPLSAVKCSLPQGARCAKQRYFLHAKCTCRVQKWSLHPVPYLTLGLPPWQPCTLWTLCTGESLNRNTSRGPLVPTSASDRYRNGNRIPASANSSFHFVFRLIKGEISSKITLISAPACNYMA